MAPGSARRYHGETHHLSPDRSPPMHRLRLLVLLVALALAAGVPVGHASSSGLVVSQVYAGGGNSGATYTNDFVELFNGGSSAADLTGMSVQYASAASTSWAVTALGGSIAP